MIRPTDRTAEEPPDLVVSGLALINPHVGQGVYARRLIDGLARHRSARFLVIAPPGVPRPPTVAPENFLNLSPFRAPRQPSLYYVVAAHRLLRLARDNFPAAVFHSTGPIVGLLRPPITVVTLHDCIYRHFSNYAGRFGTRQLLMYSAERFGAKASLVLTDSEFSRRDLSSRTRVDERKIEVLYPWVGNEFLEPIDPIAVDSLAQRYGLPKRFWLYLGGFDYRKNVEFLLRAYAVGASRAKFPPLVLAGSIPGEKKPTHCDVAGALRQTGLGPEQILLPGTISSADLPVLYRAAALLIYPSLMEGFGLPPAEAMAVGTPVLVADNSSLPEVVRQPHCLFAATAAESLIAKLLLAAEDERQFMAELPVEFTEAHGIARYLKLIGLSGQVEVSS